MEIRCTPVSQCLDKKLLVFGFEVPDLLAIFFCLACLNFIIRAPHLKLPLVWLPCLILAGILRLGKQGKPDNYLLHLVQFHFRPKYLSAFEDPSILTPPPRRS